MACLVMLLLTFAACSPDSDASDPGSITNKTYTLHFNLSPVSGSSASSRAENYTAGSPHSWEDGSKEENMKSWTVVFVKSDGTVAKVVKKPSVEEGKDKEDDVTVTGLEAGTYSVYSFANISDTELGTITEGSRSPDFDSKSFAVNGNNWNIANGIPMSNKQEVTIGSDGQPNVKQLYVVRMLSKITLKFRNMTAQDITVKNVSISDITSNPATGTENVKLLPANNVVSSTYVAQTPNLVENAKRDDFTHAITSGLTVDKTATDYDTDNSRSVSFYVNESQAGNAYPYFVVTLETNVGSQRYFMYTDWNQIARNDHHVLKLALSDYKLRLKVEDFSAIGMYPSLKDDGKQLNLTFHYPGEEFHIIPSVTKYSDPTGAEVSFTDLKWTKLKEPETDAETKAFSPIPKIVTGENRIEAETLGELGKKIGPIIYQLSVKVNDGVDSPTLVYRVAISQDLTWYSARRHNGAFWICKQ
jgi:hypothetical protein